MVTSTLGGPPGRRSPRSVAVEIHDRNSPAPAAIARLDPLMLSIMVCMPWARARTSGTRTRVYRRSEGFACQTDQVSAVAKHTHAR